MAMLSALYGNMAKNASETRAKYDEANSEIDRQLAANMLQFGEHTANRMQQASQTMYDYYARAKGARDKQINTDWATLMKNTADWANNMFNANVAGANIRLWRDEQDIQRNNQNGGKSIQTVSTPKYKLNTTVPEYSSNKSMGYTPSYSVPDFKTSIPYYMYKNRLY